TPAVSKSASPPATSGPACWPSPRRISWAAAAWDGAPPTPSLTAGGGCTASRGSGSRTRACFPTRSRSTPTSPSWDSRTASRRGSGGSSQGLMPERVDVVVVGGGPAVLATSQQLSQQHVHHRVLDRRGTRGSNWATTYEQS